MNKTTHLIDGLKDLSKIFDECGIEFWLMYGALLGMVREGKLISWDHDIDIGIWKNDLGKIEKNIDKFHRKGFTVHFTESGHVSFNKKPIYISAMFYKKNKTMAFRTSFSIIEREWKLKKGFYCHSLMEITRTLKYLRWICMPPEYIGDSPKHISYSMQKMFLGLSFMVKNRIRSIAKKILEQLLKLGCTFWIEIVPLKYFNNLKKTDFYGIDINIPKDSSGYLNWQFGDGWETPNKDYIPRSNCKAWIKLKHTDKIENEGIEWKTL